MWLVRPQEMAISSALGYLRVSGVLWFQRRQGSWQHHHRPARTRFKVGGSLPGPSGLGGKLLYSLLAAGHLQALHLRTSQLCSSAHAGHLPRAHSESVSGGALGLGGSLLLDDVHGRHLALWVRLAVLWRAAVPDAIAACALAFATDLIVEHGRAARVANDTATHTAVVLGLLNTEGHAGELVLADRAILDVVEVLPPDAKGRLELRVLDLGIQVHCPLPGLVALHDALAVDARPWDDVHRTSGLEKVLDTLVLVGRLGDLHGDAALWGLLGDLDSFLECETLGHPAAVLAAEDQRGPGVLDMLLEGHDPGHELARGYGKDKAARIGVGYFEHAHVFGRVA
mmetsp:Transcript_14988/g.44410  ORF Transcript_14988/g.44410 Transcript_14988/m.44410 type:complete len:341 (-) Transcript_14988:3282-4304(-)